MSFAPVDYVATFVDFTEQTSSISDGTVKWVYHSDKPLILSARVFGMTFPYFLAEPGDSIYVRLTDNRPHFTGKGAEKFNLVADLRYKLDAVPKPENPKSYIVTSLADYLEYIKYCNKQWEAVFSLLEAYKNSVSARSLRWIKNSTLAEIEADRLSKFSRLEYQSRTANQPTTDALCAIYDSTILYKPAIEWSNSLTESPAVKHYLYGSARLESWRKLRFNWEHDSLRLDDLRYRMYFNTMQRKYKGLVCENALIYLITRKVIKKITTSEQARMLLQNYYQRSGYPEYVKYIREFEEKFRSLTYGRHAPDFALTDTKGQKITRNDFQGKVVLMDFWFTGCKGCINMAAAMKKVEEKFRNDTNVVFASISVDEGKDKWLKSIQAAKYTTKDAYHLYTGGEGTNHPMIGAYNITGYPHFYLIGSDGSIVLNDMADPRKDNGAGIIAAIQQELAEKNKSDWSLRNDGPYVFYSHDSILITQIKQDGNASTVHSYSRYLKEKNSISFQVSTDIPGKHFTVSLQKQLYNEPCEFAKASKQLVISDIEGNFEAFRKLLQAGGVIDNHYNWTFGSGHLVCLGDFVDRGNDVTQVLWLIYSLEEKSKRAGGYVHFILGNHEIMNLQGDLRYVQDKYKNNAQRLGIQCTELYGRDTELGKWLRTRNIIEKIGGDLYVHGGISPAVNHLALTIKEMNDLARPYYDSPIDPANQSLAILFESSSEKDKTSPFWFRGYYERRHKKIIPSMEQVDSSLHKFQVRRIITGHTVADTTISLWYGDKVINVDTRHAQGHSEALLINKSHYFKINAKGGKTKLLPVLGPRTIVRQQLNSRGPEAINPLD